MFIKRVRYVTTDTQLHNGTQFAKKYRALQLKRWKISYIRTEMQVCLVYKERVYISLQRDGYAYMPYLTLWDKVSQNSAHLKANSQKNFQISKNF